MGQHTSHSTWRELLSHCETTLAKGHRREHELWSEHTHHLPALCVGDQVYIQNLVGSQPRRWEWTGAVVEVRQHHPYVVCVDGSARVTLRNRQHLRKYQPLHASQKNISSQIISRAPQGSPTNTLTTSPVVDATPTPPLPGAAPKMDTPPPPVTPSLPPSCAASPLKSSRSHLPHAHSTPRRLCFHDQDNTEPPAAKSSLPGALARLMCHNQPGAQELLPPCWASRSSGTEN